nr:hypothetical protein [Tanacetum cinerariifolium]
MPQATDNNQERFVAAPKFSEMVPFFLNTLGFTLESRSPSKFKTIEFVQPWQPLGKIFYRCLTMRVTGHDQLPLQIMQMLYCFVSNIHIDYVELLWDELENTDNNQERFVAAPKFSEMVPFFLNTLGFTLELRSPSKFKTIEFVQSWQPLGKIFHRCLTMRVTGHDQLPLQIMQMLYCFVSNIHIDYVELLWDELENELKNPATQIPYPRFTKIIVRYYMTAFLEISHRARDKYHNFEDDVMVKNIFHSRKHKDGVGMKIPSWMITNEMKLMDHYRMYAMMFLRLSQSQLSLPRECIGQLAPLERLTPTTPIPTTDEADNLVLQDTLQSTINRPCRPCFATLRQNDNPIDPDTRLEPRSDKESPEVELTAAVQPINVNEEEEELAEDDYKLKCREKGKHSE